jgi:UDP-N-acetylmuramoylalanine--D-glutamate ligase
MAGNQGDDPFLDCGDYPFLGRAFLPETEIITVMRNCRVGILGAGRSGLAAAKLLKRLGARVFLSDRQRKIGPVPAGIEVERGRNSVRLLLTDLLIRSPGVPRDLPILIKARRRGIPIWSELELASRHTRSKEIVAITGTNGKTTTTTLVGEMFRGSGRPTWVAGNIGMPLSAVALRTTPEGIVVLEVSSYQLEDIETFHPTISAILNVTPDHLEHHGTMRAYALAKARIFENQAAQDVCVLNADDVWCRRLARRCRAQVLFFSRQHPLRRGVYFHQGDVVIRWGPRRARWTLRTQLLGPHNVENILASIAMAVAGGVMLSTIRNVLARFRGVEHRLEPVRTLGGVAYINDSKGTNVASTHVALASFREPLVLIMGGEGKGTPYVPLRGLVRKKVKRLLLIGEDAGRIERALGDLVCCERLGKLRRAVARARQVAAAGDVVLLSPACASFDQYRNYEERGRHFKRLVHALR